MVSLKIENIKFREFLAEFFGTLTFVCLGCSANAVAKFKKIENPDQASEMLVLPIAWSLSLTVSIYLCGGVSGGHVNPAVTFGLASIGKFPWKKMTYYFVAQYLGAFIGSLLTFIIYRESLNNAKFLKNETIDIFGTQMQKNITVGTALVDQIISTAFFLMIICAITDERNMSVSKGLVPIAIGFVNLGVLQYSFGYNCGGPLNPARYLSPKIFSVMSIWGSEAIIHGNQNYFWIPIVACHVGGIIGCWIYRIMIENHWPNDSSFGDSELTINRPQSISVTQM